MPVCSIILTMHSQTQWNVEGRIQGQIDTPLNENGRQMSLALRNRLANEQITAIYTSDLRRAIETAEPLATAKGLRIQTDMRLREKRFRRVVNNSEYPLLPYPRAFETWNDVQARMIEVMGEIVKGNPGGRVFVVSHSGATEMFINYVIEQTADKRGYEGKRTAFNELVWKNDRWSIVSLNDIRHLEVGSPQGK